MEKSIARIEKKYQKMSNEALTRTYYRAIGLDPSEWMNGGDYDHLPGAEEALRRADALDVGRGEDGLQVSKENAPTEQDPARVRTVLTFKAWTGRLVKVYPGGGPHELERGGMLASLIKRDIDALRKGIT